MRCGGPGAAGRRAGARRPRADGPARVLPQSHAGKVVLRSWYEKNKHIFPASRWEPYDPEKKWDKYTVSGSPGVAQAGGTGASLAAGWPPEEHRNTSLLCALVMPDPVNAEAPRAPSVLGPSRGLRDSRRCSRPPLPSALT